MGVCRNITVYLRDVNNGTVTLAWHCFNCCTSKDFSTHCSVTTAWFHVHNSTMAAAPPLRWSCSKETRVGQQGLSRTQNSLICWSTRVLWISHGCFSIHVCFFFTQRCIRAWMEVYDVPLTSFYEKGPIMYVLCTFAALRESDIHPLFIASTHFFY